MAFCLIMAFCLLNRFVLYLLRGKKSAGRPVETYGSDDERAYDRETVPDTEDADYYDDEVSQFHDEKEKVS